MPTMSDSEVEASMRNGLLTFVDYFDAAIYAFILLQVLANVIDTELPAIEKINRVFLVSGVFYFFTWDWIHTRLLTLKNPLGGYRRFFFDVTTSFFAYGAASRAFQAKPTFLIYIAVILILGAVWARRTLYENPESADGKELEIVENLQVMVAVVSAGIYIYIHVVFEIKHVHFLETIGFLVLGWFFVFFYEYNLKRPDGILGGPGAPFITREQTSKLRARFGEIGFF